MTRWPQSTVSEREHMDRQVAFFEHECDYLDDFSEGNDPEEVAEANIDAADWS